MGLYKSSKLALHFLRNKNQIQNPVGIAHHHRSFHTRPSFSQSDHQLTRRRQQQQQPPLVEFSKSPFLFGSRKNYFQSAIINPDILSLSVLGIASCSIYYKFSETIPYSNRTRMVFITHHQEKMLGEIGLKNMKENEVKGKILAEDDPKSVRVRSIAKRILNAVKCGLGERIVQSKDSDSSVEKMIGEKTKKIRGNIEHMEVYDWEFLVVGDENDSYGASGSLPGGKIYISTGDLSLCESDAEIAVILAHEIGHAMARHSAEKLGMKSFQLATFFKSTEKLMNDWFVHPRSRKFEFEADYIGLLLMASAGYDPRAALSLYKKVMGKNRDLSKTHVVTEMPCHPSIEKRLEMLSRPKVMEEALRLYQERINSNQLPGNQSQN